MSAKLAARRASTKSGPGCSGIKFAADGIDGPQISPVMQKLRGSLKGDKAAPTLAFLTGQPLSNCQKMLAGHRRPNAEMYEALFGTEMIFDVILGLTEGATHPKAKAVRLAVKRLKLEDEIAKLAAGEE